MAATSLEEVPVPENKRTGAIAIGFAGLGLQAVKADEIKRSNEIPRQRSRRGHVGRSGFDFTISLRKRAYLCMVPVSLAGVAWGTNGSSTYRREPHRQECLHYWAVEPRSHGTL